MFLFLKNNFIYPGNRKNTHSIFSAIFLNREIIFLLKANKPKQTKTKNDTA